MEFVQVSLRSLSVQTHRSCEVPIPRITSDSPKLSRDATAIRCLNLHNPQMLLRGSTRISEKLRQCFGVQLPKPVDVALSWIPQLRILESCFQLIRESFTLTLESNCQSARRPLTPPVAKFVERSTLRFAADSIGVQLPTLSRLVPRVSGNGVHRSWSPVSTWLPTCSA